MFVKFSATCTESPCIIMSEKALAEDLRLPLPKEDWSKIHIGIAFRNWSMADPHGFSIGFVLNVTNLVMVLMAKLRYWTNPMRLTVVISTLLFKGGAWEGVVNQQDQKVLDRTVIGKTCRTWQRPRWKWILCSCFGSTDLTLKLHKTSTSYNVCWMQTMRFDLFGFMRMLLLHQKPHWTIKPLHSSWLFTSVMGGFAEVFQVGNRVALADFLGT